MLVRSLNPLVLAFAALPLAAQQFDWSPTFALPGSESPSGNAVIDVIHAVDDPSGSGQVVYVGGRFGSIGGCRASGIARWDGRAWSALGGGVDYGGQPSVRAIAQFQGELYIGGTFVGGPGYPASSIARWDGSSWSAVAGGFGEGLTYGGAPGHVYGLDVFDDGSGAKLYVVGQFDKAGGSVASNVARWTGGEWETVGSGSSNWIADAAVFDDGGGARYYTSGTFLDGNGLSFTGIARWNGSSWEPFGNGGIPGAQKFGTLETASERTLFAVSLYEVWRWDGTQWIDTGEGNVDDFATFDGGAGASAYALGSSRLLQWNGSSWSQVASFAQSDTNWAGRALETVDFGPHGDRRLIAGGDFGTVDTTPPSAPVTAIDVATWDGAQWSAIGPPSLGPDAHVEALCVFDDGFGDALYAGGYFTHVGSTGASRVARWDGVAWSTLGAGTDAAVATFAVFDDGGGEALYAGGNFTQAGGAPASRVARWDGASWGALGAGVDDFVEALVVFDDGTGPALIAAGGFAQAGGAPASRIARWDGATWSALGAGFPSTVLALAVFDSGSGPELYAGGSFTSPASRIARWTGSAWVGVGGGVDDAVAVMQVFAGELYVGGQFLHAGGNAIDHLAKWTGASWQPVVAAGFDKRVRALAVFDEGDGPRLYVGGWFQSPLGYLGRVEDNQFVSLLEGVDDRVLALATFDDGRAPRPALYVGGQIERAGVFSSPHIARWADGLVPPASSYCTAGTTANGCTASIAASGEARRCSNSGFDVDVTGVEGQKLGILFFGLAPAATHWGGGSSYVCVSPPTTRILTQSSGGSAGACDGAFALDLNTWMFANPYRAPAPGELVYLQAWFRDPPSPKGTSLSNALTFEIAP